MSTDLERIYLDSNATTAAAPEVVEALVPWLREHCGNPSSLHAAGSEAAKGPLRLEPVRGRNLGRMFGRIFTLCQRGARRARGC